MKELNVAILGHRFMGRAHSNAWIKAPLFFDLPAKPVLKLAVGRDEAALGAFADRWGWQETATDWREAVERDDIDVVDISLPQSMHAEVAVAAAKAGKHLFCEKPLCMTSDEAAEMLEAAQAGGVVHYLNHNYRRVPAVTLAKRLIDEGRIGTVFHWRGAYQQSWLVDPRAPMRWQLRKASAQAGPQWDLNSHSVDLAQYLVGPIRQVSGMVTQFVPERPSDSDETVLEPVEVEDAALMMVEFAGGAVGSFEATRYATGRRNRHSFEISGSKGALAWDLEDLNRLRFYSEEDDAEAAGWRDILVTEPQHPYAKWWPPGHVLGYEHSFVHAVRDFVEAVDAGSLIRPNFADGLANLRVLEAGLRSAENGRWEIVESSEPG